MLGWYDAIVVSVTGVAAGNEPSRAGADAFEELRSTVEPALESAGDLTPAEVVARIIADVRTEGDVAIRHYTEAIDGRRTESLVVSSAELDAVSEGLKELKLEDLAARLENPEAV